MTGLSLDIIRQLPKADLLCHLAGSVRPQTVLELAKEQGVPLPTENLEDLTRLLAVPPDCPNLTAYLQSFDPVLSVLQYAYAITRCVYEVCEDASKDGIAYLEVRLAPSAHTKNGLSYSQILQAAVDGAVMAHQRLPIMARILCSGLRNMSPEVTRDVADVCWRFRHSSVAGFDLTGPEDGFPADVHAAAFETIRKKYMALTINAGQEIGPRSVELALFCNPHRIGHGTRIAEDEKILQLVVDRRIPIECCVTASHQMKTVAELKNHPIRQLFQKGVITVPCTCATTASRVTLSQEYELLHRDFGFGVAEILRMIDYGFRSAFVSEGMRRRMRIESFVKAIQILQAKSIDIQSIVDDSLYYRAINVSVPPVFQRETKNPPFTMALAQILPKVDLDCRLLGSIPIPVLYRFYLDLPEAQRAKLPQFNSQSELKQYIIDRTDADAEGKAKGLVTKLVQTEGNLRMGLRSILDEAIADNVKYIEITVCPLLYTRQGLTHSQVLDIVVDERNKFCAKYPIIVRFLISVNLAVYGPLPVQEMAELAISYREQGIVGFMTTSEELTDANVPYYQATFDYLKRNHFPVAIFAGENSPQSVSCAIVQGFARRVAGGFKIAHNESLLGEVASHNIAILCHSSRRMAKAASTFSKTPIRAFFDFGVTIAWCSINNTFRSTTRAQQLYEIATTSGFDALAMLRILENSFGSMFLPYGEVEQLRKQFDEEALQILKDSGFQRLMDYSYFT
jgi:adenosine deaminase